MSDLASPVVGLFPDLAPPLADLLPAARQLAATGPISPAGRSAYLGAAAAVAGSVWPPARPAAIRAEQDAAIAAVGPRSRVV